MLRKKQAFQGSAIASFLRYASELASPALTILATRFKILKQGLSLARVGQTHYKKYFHKSWREAVRHRAKRLFLGLPLARAVRLSYQRTYSLHEPRVLAIYSSPSLTEIVVLPKLRKKRDLQL